MWDVLHATGIADTQHKTLRDLVRFCNLRRGVLSQNAPNFPAALSLLSTRQLETAYVCMLNRVKASPTGRPCLPPLPQHVGARS